MRFHLKSDQLKRNLESSYDFTFKKAFKAIDDWTYGYLDQSNIKRFLRSTGHVASKHELISILRRFDIDGDAKINFQEFQLGCKSSLSVFGNGGKKRPKSGTAVKISKMQPSPSRSKINREKSVERDITPKKGSKPRPNSSGRVANTRRRATELQNAYSKQCVGPSSNYFLDDPRKLSEQPQNLESSPSRMNKSVSFSKAVHVREYPSAGKKGQRSPMIKQRSPSRV